MKKLFSLCLTVFLLVSLFPHNTVFAENDEPLSVAALKGPTAMGLVKLMHDSDSSNSSSYSFSLAASADEVTPLLIKGELDIACVPANLASVLYNKTNGGVIVLGINTLGVLYIVEKGDAVNSLKDLKSRSIVASGKGSTPEYSLRYLLSENDIDPDTDVNIIWKNEHSECVAALATGTADIALLPQPFVTVASGKIEGLRTAVDLTKEWDSLNNGSSLITGVVIARRESVESSPDIVSTFLSDYSSSVSWVNNNYTAAASLIGNYGIVDTAVAEKALPFCNIVCITGTEMKEKLGGYLEVLHTQAPESIGGKLPEDDFYF